MSNYLTNDYILNDDNNVSNNYNNNDTPLIFLPLSSSKFFNSNETKYNKDNTTVNVEEEDTGNNIEIEHEDTTIEYDDNNKSTTSVETNNYHEETVTPLQEHVEIGTICLYSSHSTKDTFHLDSIEPQVYSSISEEIVTQDILEPSTFEEAIGSHQCEKWKTAMESEVNSHRENDTWELVDKPINKNIIDSKWYTSSKSVKMMKGTFLKQGLLHVDLRKYTVKIL